MSSTAYQLEQEMTSLPDTEKLRLVERFWLISPDLIRRLIASGLRKPESAGMPTRPASSGPLPTKRSCPSPSAGRGRLEFVDVFTPVASRSSLDSQNSSRPLQLPLQSEPNQVATECSTDCLLSFLVLAINASIDHRPGPTMSKKMTVIICA